MTKVILTEDGELYKGTDAQDSIFGRGGDDTIYGYGERDELNGEIGDDLLLGGGESDILMGNAGDDRVVGAGGSDRLYGQDGNDVVRGGDDRDQCSGGLGADLLLGGNGDDSLGSAGVAGYYGFDTDFGTEIDTLNGGSGDDFIVAGGGDVASGGPGEDRIVVNVRLAPSGESIFFSSGAFVVESGLSFSGFEILSFLGGSGHDSVAGGTSERSLGDFIDGGGGNDTLHGRGGRDFLAGGSGTDQVNGGGGNDTVSDGAGDDQLHGGAGDDRMMDGKGNDTVTGDLGDDWLIAKEGRGSYSGGSGNDTISMHTDSSGVDFVSGGEGRDTVVFNASTTLDLQDQALNSDLAHGDMYDSVEVFDGSYYADRLYGDASDNSFSGNYSRDVLAGRDGNDFLSGGEGHDTLSGGEGRDLFYFGEEHSKIPHLFTNDIVTDFVRGLDRISIDLSAFGIRAARGFRLEVNSAGEATDADRTFIFDQKGCLWFDPDGSRSLPHQRVCTLRGITDLAQTDFVLV